MSSIRATFVRVTLPLFGTGMNGKCMFKVGKVVDTVTLPPICPGAEAADPSAFVYVTVVVRPLAEPAVVAAPRSEKIKPLTCPEPPQLPTARRRAAWLTAALPDCIA
jgi:hypothetical protein